MISAANAKATQTQAANAVSSAEANAAEKANAVTNAQNALNDAKADIKTKTDATAAKQNQVNSKKPEISTQQNTVKGKQAVYKWFRGESIPAIETMLILCDALGVTIKELLVIDGEFDLPA